MARLVSVGIMGEAYCAPCLNSFSHMSVRVTAFSIFAILFAEPWSLPAQDNAATDLPGLAVIEADLPRPAPAPTATCWDSM